MVQIRYVLAPILALTTVCAIPFTSGSALSSRVARRQLFPGTHSGSGTFQAEGLNTCGVTSTDDDFVVSVSQLLFDAAGEENPENPFCGRSITASSSGKSVTVTVVGFCAGCAEFDLDFSPAAFSELADPDLGRIPITWVENN